MDMDKVPESIRDDYFTPHPEDVEDDDYESDVFDEQAADQTATEGDGQDGPQGRPGRSTETMVWDINKIAQDTIEKGGLEIGEYVLSTFFMAISRRLYPKSQTRTFHLTSCACIRIFR